MKKEKPRIKRVVMKNNRLSYYKDIIKVKKIGGSGYALLPKNLVGKFVEVIYNGS